MLGNKVEATVSGHRMRANSSLGASLPFKGPISHIGYVVSDLARAVKFWASMFGAGPFFLIRDIQFDKVEHFGKSCVFDHSAAFGQWGPIAIELQEIEASAPATLTERLIPSRRSTINHVSYISGNALEESQILAAAGAEMFLYAQFGDVEVRFHECRDTGQVIEIHKNCRFIDEFFGGVAAASRDWDGLDPLRIWK
jgi:hypothetical protein